MTPRKIETEILRMDPGLKREDRAFRAACILMGSAMWGPGADKLARKFGYPRAEVREFGERIRKAGIWSRNKVRAAWFEKDGAIALWCDVNVALGYLARA